MGGASVYKYLEESDSIKGYCFLLCIFSRPRSYEDQHGHSSCDGLTSGYELCFMWYWGGNVYSFILHRRVVALVWLKLMNWIEFNFIMPPNLFDNFDRWTNELRSSKLKKCYWLIWHVVLWEIWRVRNEIMFNNVVIDVEDTVDKIKSLIMASVSK